MVMERDVRAKLILKNYMGFAGVSESQNQKASIKIRME